MPNLWNGIEIVLIWKIWFYGKWWKIWRQHQFKLYVHTNICCRSTFKWFLNYANSVFGKCVNCGSQVMTAFTAHSVFKTFVCWQYTAHVRISFRFEFYSSKQEEQEEVEELEEKNRKQQKKIQKQNCKWKTFFPVFLFLLSTKYPKFKSKRLSWKHKLKLKCGG